ncbi:hypothetical protein [Kribbella sp. NPDC051770]|uniref:hypothetical protein n=1 Tax=Kribbella sp. NPDC051770 TaxID=3155413 RepID=UPI0034134A6A
MNDEDLITRLAASADRTNHLGFDPDTLITAGRRRIRHRWLATAAVTLTMAAAIVFTGFRVMTAQLDAPAAGLDSTIQVKLPENLPTMDVTTRYVWMLKAYMDPGAEWQPHVRGAFATGSQTNVITWRGGGTAALRVVLPGTGMPAYGWSPVDDPTRCSMYDEPVVFSSCEVLLKDGREIRVGRRGDDTLFASTVRPDGMLAEVQVVGRKVELVRLTSLIIDPRLPKPQ